MKIALIVGHRKNSQGAVGSKGISEYKFNKKLIEEIQLDLVDDHDIKVFYRRDDLSGYTERMKDLHKRIDAWGAKVSVSFHFNAAGNKSVDGHEVLYCSGSGKKLSKKLNDNFTQYLDNNNRGIKKKTKHDRGGGFLCRGKSVCILSEPFFGSHQHLYAKNGSERANLVSAYVEFLNDL